MKSMIYDDDPQLIIVKKVLDWSLSQLSPAQESSQSTLKRNVSQLLIRIVVKCMTNILIDVFSLIADRSPQDER